MQVLSGRNNNAYVNKQPKRNHPADKNYEVEGDGEKEYLRGSSKTEENKMVIPAMELAYTMRLLFQTRAS